MNVERKIPFFNEEFVLNKCNFFVETHIWPLKNKLDPEGFLSNFSPQERVYAVHLINSFMYYSDFLLDNLLISVIRGLSKFVLPKGLHHSARVTAWKHFLDNALFTFPTGENPSVTDSGHLFVRKVRDLLDIPESRIIEPLKALEWTLSDKAESVIFVDDFVGSGIQFRDTWNRKYNINGTSKSFADLTANSTKFFYCPLFCTNFALRKTLNQFKQVVNFYPGHILEPEHSILAPDSIFWPDQLKNDAPRVLHDICTRIGLPDTDGKHVKDWKGFCKLGLGIAFEHCIPDASMPIFYTTENGWNPLYIKSQI